ncbi:MAG: hypothetical protein KGZ79_12460, partial [Dethiobacter sp.]|nr:hypothetical protein [Dethiobacter sp.]
GTLKVLATMTDERVPIIPDVPTFEELGYDVKYESWRAVGVPKGTPEPILAILREAAKKAFNNPDFQKWANEANIDPLYKEHDAAVKHMAEQYPVVEGVMRKFGLIK